MEQILAVEMEHEVYNTEHFELAEETVDLVKDSFRQKEGRTVAGDSSPVEAVDTSLAVRKEPEESRQCVHEELDGRIAQAHEWRPCRPLPSWQKLSPRAAVQVCDHRIGLDRH